VNGHGWLKNPFEKLGFSRPLDLGQAFGVVGQYYYRGYKN